MVDSRGQRRHHLCVSHGHEAAGGQSIPPTAGLHRAVEKEPQVADDHRGHDGPHLLEPQLGMGIDERGHVQCIKAIELDACPAGLACDTGHEKVGGGSQLDGSRQYFREHAEKAVAGVWARLGGLSVSGLGL